MDELCNMLADKLGLAIDVSGEFLATAVPQYAHMMFITRTCSATATLVIALSMFLLGIYFCKKLKTAKSYDVESYVIATFFAFLAAGLSVFVFFMILPSAICWYATPDAMLLKELIGTVVK